MPFARFRTRRLPTPDEEFLSFYFGKISLAAFAGFNYYED